MCLARTNLRFNLNRNEEHLQQLRQKWVKLKIVKNFFECRAVTSLKNTPEISQLLWFDGDRKVV